MYTMLFELLFENCTHDSQLFDPLTWMHQSAYSVCAYQLFFGPLFYVQVLMILIFVYKFVIPRVTYKIPK